MTLLHDSQNSTEAEIIFDDGYFCVERAFYAEESKENVPNGESRRQTPVKIFRSNARRF